MSDYCEWPEFYFEKWVVARKEHCCCECSSPIVKGEKHGVFTGKWDGQINKYRQHFECEDACRFVRDYFEYGECIGFGCLLEHISDYDWLSKKEDEECKMFRKILAHVKFRKHKKRPLKWFPKYELPSKLSDLKELRA